MLGKNVAGKDPDPFFYLKDASGQVLYRSEIKRTTKEAVWPAIEITTRQLMNGARIELMDKDPYTNADVIGETIILGIESFVFGEPSLVLTCGNRDLMRKRGDCGTVTITPAQPSRVWQTFQRRLSTDGIPIYDGYLEKQASRANMVQSAGEQYAAVDNQEKTNYYPNLAGSKF